MATVGPLLPAMLRPEGSSAEFSLMTMTLPAGMLPKETGKRTGWESVRMPNQEATMPAAWRALGLGWAGRGRRWG